MLIIEKENQRRLLFVGVSHSSVENILFVNSVFADYAASCELFFLSY